MAGSAHASMGTGILTLGSSSHSWGGYIRDYADLSLSNHYEKYNVWICMILKNVENNPITIRVYRVESMFLFLRIQVDEIFDRKNKDKNK